ncbi:MAG: hypothetical protein U0441_24225 [Polyangiaceae bacterium]
MSTALALRLIASGAVSQADAEAALLSSLARRVPFVRALIDGGAIGEAALDQWLEQLGGIGLRQVVGMPELVNRLPPHFCRRMGVLPIGVDHAARVVELAAADPLDPHVAAEVAFHLGVQARVMRAPIATIEEAIRRIELSAEAAAGRARRATPPCPHGAPESSNPPPPPPDPAPIPLVKRTGERSPDTLRLYKQTLRPGAGKDDLDYEDVQPSGPMSFDALPESQPIPLGAPKSWDADAESAPPKTLRDSGRLRELGQQIEGETRPIGDSGRLRDIASQITLEPPPSNRPPRRSEPNLRELAEQLTNEPIPRTLRDSQRLRDIAQQASRTAPDPRDTSPRSVRESQRLRDILEPPPPIDRLRDSQMRLRDLAAQLPRDATPPTGIDLRAHAAPPDPEAPLSAMVPPEQTPPPGEPPTVSFPSLPPPSVMDQPGLLAADTEWSAPPPAPEPRPEAAPKKERRPSRFARPAIDIDIPLPPSENRARRQRTTWDLPLAEPREEPPEPLEPPPRTPPSLRAGDPVPPSMPMDPPLRPDPFDTSAVLEALRGAASRDDVVVAALRGLRTVGRRTGIFVVRRDGFHGWACNVELADQARLRTVSIPGDAPSLFATAVAAGSYFGPVPSNAAHAGLLAVLEHVGSDVAVAVARAGGKPVMVLFADDLVETKRRILPRLQDLADAVGAALSRLLAARL